MHTVQLVLMGAEVVVETGGVINKLGSLQVGVLAKTFNVPVYIVVESYKFARIYPLNQKSVPVSEADRQISEKARPKELDEAAEIDGCGKISILFRILVPVVKPAIMTASIFAFYWVWQDFFQPLIFMNTPSKFTLSLALNLFLDPNTYNNYGALFAMSLLSLLPALIIFIIFQRYLVEGIAMDGIKG